MKMLAYEVTEMNDYGHFVDIDNGTLLTTHNMERGVYKRCVEKNKPSITIIKPHFKNGLFCLNTICCVAVSFLFLKAWVLPNKQL
jgi:hypothetical protein